MGGAMSGGAAASPVAGVAVAAASAGVDATYSVGRLGEMIMAIGLVYGHDATTADERRTAVVTIMGLADGAAVGVSGLAARAGAKGGARLLQRIPTATAATAPSASGRALSRLGANEGALEPDGTDPLRHRRRRRRRRERTAGPSGRAGSEGVLRRTPRSPPRS